MGLVDDDETNVAQRCEHGAARADDHVDLAARRGLPGLEAFPFREGRVEHGDAIAEGGLKARGRLRRERDLGDEDDRASARFENARDRLEIHQRLPAPGDPVQQHLSK